MGAVSGGNGSEAVWKSAKADGKRWSAKFGQVDKWKICLKAARMPRIRSDHGKPSHDDRESRRHLRLSFLLTYFLY